MHSFTGGTTFPLNERRRTLEDLPAQKRTGLGLCCRKKGSRVVGRSGGVERVKGRGGMMDEGFEVSSVQGVQTGWRWDRAWATHGGHGIGFVGVAREGPPAEHTRGAIVVGPYTRGAVHTCPPATVHSPCTFFWRSTVVSV